MPLVMARHDIAGTFRRCIRDKAGNITETLEFPAGVPVEVPYDKVQYIEKDLYHALFPIWLNNGKAVPIEEDVFRGDVITSPNELPDTAAQSDASDQSDPLPGATGSASAADLPVETPPATVADNLPATSPGESPGTVPELDTILKTDKRKK